MAAEDDSDGTRHRLHAGYARPHGGKKRITMRPRVDIFRGLRFRLTISYLLLFSALLVVIGLYFRHNLQVQTEGDVRAVLEEVWGEAKGYLKIENYRPSWTADQTDPEDAHIVDRLRYVILLTDSDGNVLLDSPVYESIGI